MKHGYDQGTIVDTECSMLDRKGKLLLAFEDRDNLEWKMNTPGNIRFTCILLT